MGMTMTQKILAAHAGLESVEAGQLIEADLDLVLGNDITSPVAIHEMDEKMKDSSVFHKDKIALVLDHFVPNKDIKSAQQCKPAPLKSKARQKRKPRRNPDALCKSTSRNFLGSVTCGNIRPPLTGCWIRAFG